MTRDMFKIIHSELIQQVQCIEYNLKVSYAAMRKGNFDKNFQSVQKSNLGKIARALENLDYSDDCPALTEDEYELIDDIREIRNYWCHQCYIDFVYIRDDYERERAFQKIANRLHYDEQRTYDLFEKTEEIKQYILSEFK